MSEKLTYTIDEAARLLGISRNSAYEAARRGELPAIRLGRRILVPRSRLEAMLEQDGTSRTVHRIHFEKLGGPVTKRHTQTEVLERAPLGP